MSEPKHTPGPWRFRSFGGEIALCAEHSGLLIVLDPGNATRKERRDRRRAPEFGVGDVRGRAEEVKA